MATPRGNLDTVWTLSLIDTSEDKHANRVGVQAPASHELIGVDGLHEGGLSPFPGFRRVHEFDKDGWNDAVGSSAHDGSSRIVDCFPINFLVGDDGYAYGFVYRVRRKGTGASTASLAADVFCDFFTTKVASGDPRWFRSNLVMANVPVSPVEDSVTGKQMSVAVYGRYVYVFVEGESPVAIYTQRNTPWTFQTLTSPGPGLQPQFVSPEQHPTGVMGALTSFEEGANTYPSRAILHLDADLPFSETLPTPYFDTATYPDLSTDCHPLDAGDYAFAYVLYDSTSGRRSALSKIAQVRHNTDPSAGSDFDDPATLSILDGAPLYAILEVCYDHTKFDQMYIYRSVQVQRAGGTYIASILHLERIVNLADYHTLNTDLGAVPPVAQSMYVYMLEDKQLVYQDVFADYSVFDEEMPKAGMAAMYEGTLLCAGQDSSVSASSTIEIRPGDTQIGVGELRWSSLSYSSPELFPPSNRYVPAVQSDSIVAVCQVGANAIGFSNGRQYHLRKEAGAIKIQPIHAGYGIVNPRAVTDIGTLAYFVTSKGVQAVDTMGALDNVKSINNLVIDRWKDYHHEICVSCDSEISAFFVMVPSLGEMAVFWMSSAAVTEVHDLPFTLTCRGVWPKVFTFSQTDLASNEGELNTTYLNDLVDRAFFIQNPYITAENETIDGASWFVHIIDNNRERLQVGGTGDGETQSTLIEFGGDAIFPVDGWFDSTQLIVGRGPSNVLNPGDDVNGLWMYVLKAQDRSLIGKKVRIIERYDPVAADSATYTLEGDDLAALYAGLVADDIVGISPVKFRWVGAPIIPQSEEGDQMASSANFFVVKHVKSVTGSFVGVSGTALTYNDDSVVRYSGLVYAGISETPHRAETLDHNGNLILSIEDNNPYWAAAFGDSTINNGKFGIDGAVLTPGIEVIVPNLTYTLIGALVSGAMRPTYRAGAM